MSNYRYTPASLAASAKKHSQPKKSYIDLFQATLDEQFYNASNWYTIEEETAVGSWEFEDVDVRISHVINAETGLKLGDDWKTLFFQNASHPVEVGQFYKFEDNTWLVTNIEFSKNLTGTCTIRRCNNTLRWINELTGVYYEEPCAIEYLVKEPRDYATQGSPFMTPGGFLHIWTQLNNRTSLIGENQRFLFGNSGHWTGYKVIGAGVNDFRNNETFDNDSASILVLDLIANYVNSELDDVINGIADVYTNLYEISLSSSSVEGATGDTIQLTASVLYNGDSVTRTLLWESSNTSVATVSQAGLVTCVSSGSATITAGIQDNPENDTCVVIVSETPSANYETLISPDINYVLEGKQRDYTVYLYENNVVQSGSFVIECSGSNVPSANYTFTQLDGNSFRIANILRDMDSHLRVTCTTTGSYTPKTFDVYLRGAWLHENI